MKAFTLWIPKVHRVFYPDFGGTDYKIIHPDGKVAAYVAGTCIGIAGQSGTHRMGRRES